MFLPKLPQNCCPFGAPLKINVETIARTNRPQKIQKYLEMLEINLVPEDKNKPRITKDELAKVINLTKLIGSKL